MTEATATRTLTPRAAVARMGEYHPPLSGRQGLRLDFNENTFGPSPVVAKILANITADSLTRYPEREPVERIAAAHFALDPSQILLTNGVDEAIHLLCEAFLEPVDEAIIVVPTFSMYRLYAEMTGASVRTIQSDASLQFPFEHLASAISDQTRLIAIASPNNPTGSVVSRQHILELARLAPHAAVLVDEAYYHFHGDTVIQDTATVTNLFVARTFSKAYGLANLRIGMIAGHPSQMRYVRKVSSPYNVNGVALACLPAALADEDYIRWYSNEVHTGRTRTEEFLTTLGVPWWPSHANFVLMNIGPLHREFVTAMRNRGILVRDRSSDPGCDGCVRITIGIAEHTARGLAALQDSLKEIAWQKP